MTRAAPPNRAPRPIIPVCIGAAPAVLVEVASGSRVGTAVTVVDAETPDVNGTSDALLAPVKAGTVVVAPAVGGAAEVLLGLRTLSMTWTTPPAIKTSGTVTRAELTKTDPLTIEIVTLSPLTVSRVVLVKMLLYPTVPWTTW